LITSPIWLPATLLAGGLQAWRTAVQRRLGKTVSVNAAGLVRYLFGLPFALAMAAAYQCLFAPIAWPAIGAGFLPFCIAGGLAQIIATNLLLMAFEERSFVTGIAFSKTEAIQGAALSVLLLGEHLPVLSWAGIALGVAGVMLLAMGGERGLSTLLRGLTGRGARYGIASGFFFALTAIGIRRATQEVTGDGQIGAALLTLAATVTLQTLMQGGYLLLRERDQLAQVFTNWRVAGQVGLLSSLGSACWFTGFASAPVALVRIVGQIEIAFTLGFAHLYLREHIKRYEVAGLVLVGCGVVLAVAGA
jgi:drug/metabolite transporter (DMT)-like permease